MVHGSKWLVEESNDNEGGADGWRSRSWSIEHSERGDMQYGQKGNFHMGNSSGNLRGDGH